jgi:site-specific recombinase XerD
MMRKLPDYLNEEEVNRILDLAARDTYRNYLMIKLMWQCGLRISEVSKLMVRDIDFLDKKIKIVQSKRDKDRYVPATSELLREIRFYLDSQRIEKGYVFLSSLKRPISTRRIQQLVEGYVSEAKIQKKVTPHTFRHSFAVTFLKHTKNLRALQQILGHSNIKATEIYLNLTFDDIQGEYEKVWQSRL